MSKEHRVLRKTYETEMWVDNKKLPLNHFVQETMANIITGFTKALKELEEPPKNIEIKIRRLSRPMEVDAHTYP